jgi:hypothetical protein
VAATIVAATAFLGRVPSTSHRGDGMSAPHDKGPIDWELADIWTVNTSFTLDGGRLIRYAFATSTVTGRPLTLSDSR